MMSSFSVGLRYALHGIDFPTPTSTFKMPICVALTFVLSANYTGIDGIFSVSLGYIAPITTRSDALLPMIISRLSCSLCTSLSCLFSLNKQFLFLLNILPCFHS